MNNPEAIRVLLTSIGAFIVLLIGQYVILRKLPLDLKKKEMELAKGAWDLAQEAIENRKKDLERISSLEETVRTQGKLISGFELSHARDVDIIVGKDLRINQLERINLDYERRIQGLEALVRTHEQTISELQSALKSFQNGLKKIKKTTDELKQGSS